MDTAKIQLLLHQHGKTPAMIARELGVNPGLVSRTMSSSPAGTSRRVRLYIANIVGFMPSALFDLPVKSQLFEDFKFCSQVMSKPKSNDMSSSSDSVALS